MASLAPLVRALARKRPAPAAASPLSLAAAAARAVSSRAALFPAAPPRGPKSKGKSAPAAAAASPAPAAVVDDAGDIEGEVAAASPKDLKSQMAKHVDWAKRELSKLRGATASPSACGQRWRRDVCSGASGPPCETSRHGDLLLCVPRPSPAHRLPQTCWTTCRWRRTASGSR